MPQKNITILGMSGVGKTYISTAMAQQGWSFFSCDYEIGSNYLAQTIRDTLGVSDAITVENLSYLSQFVGQVGDVALGGLPFDIFCERQGLYYDAECQSLRNACQFIDAQKAHTLIDSTGSLCEIEDRALVEKLADKTLFVYLQASQNDEDDLIRRAQEYPKPLFFPPSHFQDWLDEYLKAQGIESAQQMRPNGFSRWVFPKLLASRLPKYQELACRHGVTIPAAAFQNISSSDSFIDIIAAHLS